MFRVYTLRTLDEDTIMKWLAVTMCIVLLATSMMSIVSPGSLLKLSAVALAATFDPKNVWWWVSYAAFILGLIALDLDPPAGIALALTLASLG